MPAACFVKVRKTAGRILKFIPERERPHYLPRVYTLGTADPRDSAWILTGNEI